MDDIQGSSDLRRLYVRVLGPFAAARDIGFTRPLRISGRKTYSLLAFLAVNPRQSASREELATLQWASSSDQQARHSLRQALHELRREIGDFDLIQSDVDRVWLRPGGVWVDALELEGLPTSCEIARLKDSLELARGAFLEDLHPEEEPAQDWQREQRLRFEKATTTALVALATQSDHLGEASAALAAAERLLAIDPLREDWQRLALRLYARHRGKNDALAQSRLFVERLRQELDVDPEPETKALLAAIRSGQMTTADSAAALSPIAATSSDTIANGRGTPFQKLSHGRTVAILGLVLLAVSVLAVSFNTTLLAKLSDAARTRGSAPLVHPNTWQPPHRFARTGSAAPAETIIPIAVLPFTAYGDSATQIELIADMMTDDLINNLSKLSLLRVISHRTSQAYRGTTDAAAIGRELDVQFILEGSVRLLGEKKVRVNIALIEPTARHTLWTSRIERDDGNQQAVQDEIVGRIARELQLEVYFSKSKEITSHPTVAALNHRGYAALISASNAGIERLNEAEVLFLEALKIDPDSLHAKRGLGMFHALVGVQLLTPDTQSHLQQAAAILRATLQEDPNSSTAYFFLGLIDEGRRHVDEALRLYERSIELNPSNALAYAHTGHVLIFNGQAREALDHIDYALRLSPHDPHRANWYRFLGEAFLELGERDRSLSALEQSYQLNSRHPLTLRGLAAAHAAADHLDQSRRYLQELQIAAPYLSSEKLLLRADSSERHQPEYSKGLRLAVRLLDDPAERSSQ